ncbi:MAG: hypothetical protein CVT93_03175 [Bacteroidetes bacterium HGW-Bacteroidetes-10]|nr:MAG: hypothetical protein CVT93_03175 [Bacteroidetes bacterium HGW-Bacteroidetes-10]
MKNMKKIYISLALMATALLGQACTEKFENPEPFKPVALTPNITIKDLKARYVSGTPYEINDNLIIGGKVNSTDEFGNFYRSIYIQDATGGIEVKIGKTTLYNEYKEGQTVYVKARHLFLGAYGGMVQLGEKSAEARYETSYIETDLRIKETIFRGATGEKVVPAQITASSDIHNGLLGTLVTLKEVTLVDQNMTTWARKATPELEAGYGEQKFKLEGGTIVVVRTSGYAKFANQPAPPLNSKVDITGVLTKFNSTWQLAINSLEGVTVLN